MNKNLFIVFIFTILIIFTCSGTIFAVDSQYYTKINTTKNTKLTNSTNSSVSPQNSALVSSNSNSGLVPIPIDLSYLKGSATSSSKTSTVTANADSLPSSYDLRTRGKVTSVKNQGSLGTCWAFATYGSMESCLLPSGSYDFSENNMKNLLSSSYSDGFDRSYGGGGNFFMSTAYLARYSGPVNESDDPYNENSGVSPSGLTVQKHIQEMTIIPGRSGSTNNDNLKQAVMTYGAVYTTMYMDTSYFNYSTNSYYYPSSTTINHAVCIVGWDDNYSRYNFKTDPGYNGAFIVKNSWGTSWGESGYFYVSYYDNSFAYDSSAVFYNAEATNNYTKIYQYDPLGWTSSVGYGTTNAWGSNVFTSSGNDKLTAVSTYISSANTTYQLYIYLNPTTGNPRSGTLATTQSGTITSPGYKSIRLNTPVSLTNGQKFSVILQYTTPGYNYPIPMETPIANYSSKATASSGQSYISYNGTSWADITSSYTNTNVCIKAFTGSTQADVSMTMTASKSTLNVWEPFYYTISLYNSGPGAATNVRVTGSKPGGMQLDNYSASQGSFSNEVWTVGTLSSGSSATLYLYVTPTTGTAGLTMIYPMNETQTEYDPTPATASATVHIKKADLIITNTANQSSLNVGDTGIFTLNVTNSGPDVANIQITDLLSQLPAGFTAGTPSTGTYNSSNGLWTITNLAPGTPATLTFSGVIQAAQAGTTITNHATETQTEYPFTFTFSDATIYVKKADVVLSEVGSVSGSNVAFNVTASNGGPDDAHNITITDTIPAGLSSPTVNVTAGSYVINSGVITWTLDLANGSFATMTLSGTGVPLSTVFNTASVVSQDEYNPNLPQSTTKSVYVPSADVRVNIYTTTGKYDNWDVNNDVTWAVDLINNGPDDAHNVTATITLPAGLEFRGADSRSNGNWSYNAGTVTWTIDYMPSGGAASLDILTYIKQSGTLTITATKTSQTETDPNTTNNTRSRNLTIPQEIDIQVNQTVDNLTPSIGQTITYTITTTNNGPNNATGVTIKDSLPTGLTYQTADTHGTGTYDNTTGTWTIGNLNNGQTATLTITATINSTPNTTIINTATLQNKDQYDWNFNNNSQNTIINQGSYTPSADVRVNIYTTTGKYDNWDVNNDVTWAVDLINNGPDDAHNVTATITLPAGLEFRGADSRSNGNWSYNAGTVTWTIDYMPSGGAASLDILTYIKQSGTLTITATKTSQTETDPNTNNNTRSRNLTIPQEIDIQVNQTVDNLTPSIGQTITYTITTTNNGPNNATGVTIKDSLPTGLTYQTADTHGTGTYDNTTGTWTIGNLNNGQTATLTITATINSTPNTTIINTATLQNKDQFDWNFNNNSQKTYLNVNN